jgi:5'-methylthioadenosine phosphorylase
MARLAVVGGNATRGLDLGAPDWEAIDRHGGDRYTLPHRIDHAANMRRLVKAGCDRVLGIGSVGGLQPQFGPGTFVCPDDFVAWTPTPTTRDGRDSHAVRGFAAEWRVRVLEEWGERCEPSLVDGGVYCQTAGPRLETEAEVRALARDGDVVGMTLASECVVASELGLDYAAVCVVVNYANGVGEEPLSRAEIERGEAEVRAALDAALGAVLPALAD